MTDWRSLAATMSAGLTTTGELSDPAWQRAFTQTPRHMFVPDCGLDDAYRQTALVTQWRTADDHGNKRPTSSASSPAAVAVMLERLAVADHHRVLEIGTGTGYNAALLCHRLGSSNVWSIDLDSTLVADARTALAKLGYQPRLITGDGYGGVPMVLPSTVFSRPVRSPMYRPHGSANSPRMAVSSPPSPGTRPNHC